MAGKKDFELDADNNIVINNFDFATVEENDRVKQMLLIHLLTFKNEWFLDTEFGVPYIENILTKPIDVPLIADILKSEIVKVADVTRITKFDIEVDAANRSIDVTFTVITTFSTINDLSVSI